MNGRLEKLETKKAKIAAEIQRVRAREAAEVRKADTRRKILVGALILSIAERGELISKNELVAALDRHLTRPQDRQLFDLASLPVSTPETE